MIKIQIDEAVLHQILQAAIQEKISAIDKDLVFWDTKELKRRTCMSWNTIQDNFFHDERFPKVKIGGKWFYPAKETEAFLIMWLKEKGETIST